MSLKGQEGGSVKLFIMSYKGQEGSSVKLFLFQIYFRADK